MVTVEEAQSLIEAHSPEPRPMTKSINDCLGYILAENIMAPFPMPHFRQSAMDGYAVQLNRSNKYVVFGESKAGDVYQNQIENGYAQRVFTGAMIPENADTVIIQEHTEISGNELKVNKIPPKHSNIRPIGEQCHEEERLLTRGQKINAATIGILASIGMQTVPVFQLPKIGIMVTGNELIVQGEELVPGKVYDSNSYMLKAALQENGFFDVEVYWTKDDLHNTLEQIKNALSKCDILLISGGISVGDYDYVKTALLLNQVEEIFYKVNQKPGKPLWFGKKGNSRVFGLPGNPAASLTCFYVYVLPELIRQSGKTDFRPVFETAKTSSAFLNKTGKALFLKAKKEGDTIHILDKQQSSMLSSFADSNALAYIPPDTLELKKDENIQFINI